MSDIPTPGFSQREVDPNEGTKPGFSRIPPPAAAPGYDPSDSPLIAGGRQGSPTPVPADTSLKGLTTPPHRMGQPRVMFRVRREGWVSRRAAARSRFGNISRNQGPSTPRILAGLEQRWGLFTRSKQRTAKPRFDLRGLH